MKKNCIFFIAAIILLLTHPFALKAQQNYELSYNVKGLTAKSAYLISVKGNTYDVVDSCKITNGLIKFAFNDSLPAGVYRMAFADSLFTDVILNKESVMMENTMPSLNHLTVVHSEENRIYYAYWKLSRLLNDTIDAIATTGNLLYEASGHRMTPELDSMQRQANALNRRLLLFADSIVNKNQGLLASALIKAYTKPDYYRYLKSPGAFPYKSPYDFLRDHYFDNINFKDDRLLCSEILYVSITDYLNMFGDPPSTENYKRAIDTLMQRFSVNPEMKEYALKLLLNTFETSSWEKVFIYLADTYVYSNSCEVEGGNDYLATAEVMKNLAPGKPAPAIQMPGLDGKKVSLYDIKAKITLILFWSAECSHCHEAMPALIGLYDAWHPKGLEIFAVSIDTNIKEWKTAAAKTDSRWIHVCDLKGVESETLKAYHTWKTPGFFLLGPDKIILSKPMLVSQIKDALEQYLK